MSDKPEWCPQDVWDEARAIDADMSWTNAKITIAKAIIKARKEAYDECLAIAEKERRTDLAVKYGYKPTWYVMQQEIIEAIRSKAEGGE